MVFNDIKNFNILKKKFVLDLRDEYILIFSFNLLCLQIYEFDFILRNKAEIENIKKRSKIEIQKMQDFALYTFINDLIPIVDNFERALDLLSHDNKNLSSILKGINLTYKMLIDILLKSGITIINTNNIKFDPSIHQAVSMVKSFDIKHNYIVNVIQKGYLLNGRLVRPAMVSVSE